ncbi:hypothetical protein DFA_08273 [Cavenderia fasciculata]|uniref:Cytochrome c oxidase assembly protein COX20, mitochondrial n=1 Tax=Cavenderia fasciculata TaxID=261658 RepID=F4Q5M1_CACFS|nr:uncharacterized protein DFA_08273 [Cavenderia fasciculata]EGG17280.1 hypothetical protein DFA_08273 [Cavenderia fasciculata]|eukprot:XP_004355764.1 hypothetical protein DFA_08273 [Cavenderia fasciculata]
MSESDKEKGLSNTSITENENINLYPISNEPQGFWDRYNPARIPCFKDSFLYGIGSGVTVTFLSSVFSSHRGIKSADFGIITFALVAGCYWPICTYNKQVQDKKIKMVMDAQVAEMNRRTKEELSKINKQPPN